MTKEQILRLESLMADRVYVGYDTIKRLLEERKRLVDALRPFAETGGVATFRVQMHNYGMPIKEYDLARAAIAFAEAPQD